MSITADISTPTAAAPSPRELNVPQQLNTARGTMRFREAPGVCGLGLFTYLSAVTAALTLRVPQDTVNGTAGQSVLLPVSYTVPDPHGYLRITWTRAGSVTVEYTCFSGQECYLKKISPHITVSDPFKHRAVLFPENASLLLRDLQVNDSGIFELSISHTTGMEKRNITLVVQPDTAGRIVNGNRSDIGNGTNAGNTTSTDWSPTVKNEVIISAVVLAVALIILCLIVKMGRGKHDRVSVCQGSQKQKEEEHTTQDYWEQQKRADVLYTEIGWIQQANPKRKMHTTKETDAHASVQENSSPNCPAVLYTERKSPDVPRTDGRKMQNPEEDVDYAQIQIRK
ncbi:uncharacterized protein LOC127585843 [Pristis pectinata]|uniref:uncharacterized protein LOC127585843 n=1 Tax=Pristis pectinata TaxID=685728 RepID=UPI00223E079F|nr:uncharacterized protein LOC127585843 [Pristis pectinata]